jgi:hypothetical protein
VGETLRRRFGPLPIWAWALIFVGVLALYLSYRQKRAAAIAAAQTQNNLSSNLGTVPVSNLTTAAQPMPIQLGDTFVNTTVPTTVNTPVSITNQPPSYTLQPAPPPALPPGYVPFKLFPGTGAGMINPSAGPIGSMANPVPGSQVWWDYAIGAACKLNPGACTPKAS